MFQLTLFSGVSLNCQGS